MIEPTVKFMLCTSWENAPRFLQLLEQDGQAELLAQRDTSAVRGNIELLSRQFDQVRHGLDFLTRHCPDKKDLLGSFIPKKNRLTNAEFTDSAHLERTISLARELLTQEHDLKDLVFSLARVEDQIRAVWPWRELNFAYSELSFLNQTALRLGSVEKKRLAALDQALSKELRARCVVQLADQNDKTAQLALFYLEDDTRDADAILKEFAFQEQKPSWSESPRLELTDLEHTRQELLTEIAAKSRALTGLAHYKKDLQTSFDYLAGLLNQERSRLASLRTKNTLILTAWTTQSYLSQLTKKLSPLSAVFAIELLGPVPGEVGPVVLKNNRFVAPFESVTKIYGLPQANELDPTPYLAPFFAIFFGLSLTDAGYGVALIFAVTALLFGLKLKANSRKLFDAVLIGGFATVVLGLLFGGIFGLNPADWPAVWQPLIQILDLLQLINPAVDPVGFLLLMFALGFVHILFGLGLKFYHNIKLGKFWTGLFDQGSWLLVLTSLLIFSLQTAGSIKLGLLTNWLVYGALLFLVLAQGRSGQNLFKKLVRGLLSLYGLIGYLSDILSYSRLLALGLATGIVALVVNLIAGIIYNLIPIPIINTFFFVLVLIVGHSFNLVISALGAFIHSSRLQFVEFFPKFMEGGGRPLKSFQRKLEYSAVTD